MRVCAERKIAKQLFEPESLHFFQTTNLSRRFQNSSISKVLYTGTGNSVMSRQLEQLRYSLSPSSFFNLFSSLFLL